MDTLRLVLTIVQVLCAVILVAVVMLQTGNSGLSSAIAGSGESFMSKNKNFGKEARLATYTKIVAALFLILTFALNLI